MSDEKSLDAAKKAVRRAADQQAPSAEAFVPEIRSNIKWRRSAAADGFRPEAQTMLVWHYGVPFKDAEGFHDWLATNEIVLAGLCTMETGGAAQYLGTYLHMDTGAPRYQTLWGFQNDTQSEDLLEAKIASVVQLRNMVATLRGYWSRDSNASDHRFGLARHFLDFGPQGADGPFWDATVESRDRQPEPKP